MTDSLSETVVGLTDGGLVDWLGLSCIFICISDNALLFLRII